MPLGAFGSRGAVAVEPVGAAVVDAREHRVAGGVRMDKVLHVVRRVSYVVGARGPLIVQSVAEEWRVLIDDDRSLWVRAGDHPDLVVEQALNRVLRRAERGRR